MPLVVCNGVYKTGSTWVFMFLKELTKAEDPPNELADLNQPGNIDFLKAPEYFLEKSKNSSVILKSHTFEHEYLEDLRALGAKVVVTTRDAAEILASHYHHFCNEKFILTPFLYGISVGFLKGLEVVIYEEIATSNAYCDCTLDYDSLMKDPFGSLSKVAYMCGIDATTNEIQIAVNMTDMRSKPLHMQIEKQGGRAWFFNRPRDRLPKSTEVLFTHVIDLARWLMSFRVFRKCLLYILFLDGRRSQYKKFKKKSLLKTLPSE